MPDRDSLPSYSDVVAYYLRDDVAAFMWRLCQGRLLKFFHHSAYDLRSEHKTPAGLAFHGVASVADLCQRVRAATANAPSYPYPFFPFWGMQSTAVNVYGAPDRLLGWDMRFEFDFDLAQSFAAVLPVAAVLEHLGVPYVSKFSGHRSLHLLIPAEAFPAGMKARADHAEWMRVFDALGRLFCRLSPYINATSAGLSKEIMLTAPYSLHRYHGLLSLPLSIEQSLRFSPAMAALERFPGVAWPFPDPEDPGLGAQALIDLAARADQSPGALAEVARGAFAGPAWERFNRRVVPGDVEPHSTLGLLMAGASGLGGEAKPGALDPRVRLALAAMDDPQNKTYKHLRLIDEVSYVTPFDTYVRQRRANATVLDAWVQGGSARALATVQSILVDPQYKAPLLLALRLYAILPEDARRPAGHAGEPAAKGTRSGARCTACFSFWRWANCPAARSG